VHTTHSTRHQHLAVDPIAILQKSKLLVHHPRFDTFPRNDRTPLLVQRIDNFVPLDEDRHAAMHITFHTYSRTKLPGLRLHSNHPSVDGFLIEYSHRSMSCDPL